VVSAFHKSNVDTENACEVDPASAAFVARSVSSASVPVRFGNVIV